jgi:Fe-S cluster assembly scaffold protein SufB
MFIDLQQKAVKKLATHFQVPQRYGTAFHITPPFQDIRTLRFKENAVARDDWNSISVEDQARFLAVDEEDVYLMQLLAVSLPHLIQVKEHEQRTLQLQAESGVQWIVLEAGAELTMEDYTRDTDLNIRRIVVLQHESSHFQWSGLRAHSSFLNEQLTVYLLGREATTTLTHIVWGEESDQYDIAATVHHQAPASRSLMTMRAALRDKAHSIYRGLIEVAEAAPGSKGYQQGKSLLLSPGAVSDMLPELKIRTDDVQCSHGVTTTHLDDITLFYLRSRGLSDTLAQRLATQGFYHNGLALSSGIGKVLEDVIG